MSGRRTIMAVIMATLATNLPAALCGKCKELMFIASVGTCAECAGQTASGAHPLCPACARRLGQCEHCRARLQPAPADKQPAGATADAKTVAARLWAALAAADIDAMRRHYANEVTLLPGSEFLKQEWGVNPSGDRNRPVALRRDELMRTYLALFDKVGRDTWRATFGKTAADDIALAAAQEDNVRFKGVKKGDVLATVIVGAREEALHFVLRQAAGRGWVVVMECADY